MTTAPTLTLIVALLGSSAFAQAVEGVEAVEGTQGTQGKQGIQGDHRPFADEALGETWIDGISTTLLDDLDRDGYASSLSVEIDVDSYAGPIAVFARLSLSGSDGYERLLYDTNTFTVDGRTYSDRLDVELALLGSFPSDRYELVAEIRDARSSRLLDVVDGRDFGALSGLTLEDRDRDPGYVDDYPYTGTYTTEISVSQSYESGYYGTSTYAGVEYGGAQGPLALGSLALLAWFRGRRSADPSGR